MQSARNTRILNQLVLQDSPKMYQAARAGNVVERTLSGTALSGPIGASSVNKSAIRMDIVNLTGQGSVPLQIR